MYFCDHSGSHQEFQRIHRRRFHGKRPNRQRSHSNGWVWQGLLDSDQRRRSTHTSGCPGRVITGLPQRFDFYRPRISANIKVLIALRTNSAETPTISGCIPTIMGPVSNVQSTRGQIFLSPSPRLPVTMAIAISAILLKTKSNDAASPPCPSLTKQIRISRWRRKNYYCGTIGSVISASLTSRNSCFRLWQPLHPQIHLHRNPKRTSPASCRSIPRLAPASLPYVQRARSLGQRKGPPTSPPLSSTKTCF